MLHYTPPSQDLAFILNDVLDANAVLSALPRYNGVSTDVLLQIADEAGRFATEQVLPLNHAADQSGCTWENGTVQTPPGFKQAYAKYCELGWPSMCADEADGGQALPRLVFSITNEILSAASHAFVMYAAIHHCASACLRHSATESLQRRWLPLLAAGEVTSSMCMTEPHAGSDIGLLTTRAEPTPDGSYLISGQKIFASGGDHDLTENIAHLVLARIAGAPSGSRGLSLFLVPKILDDGQPNPIFCDGIEHKMGLHGSATCSLRFESAQGWLVGEPNKGLAAMFPMMNEARLLSGLQALGISDLAFQNALAYAQDRRQGRAANKGQPSPIIHHPDVQRMLLTQKAFIEGARTFVHWVALLIDQADWATDAQARQDTTDLVGLLTPIIKGFLTENAQTCTYNALQVFGGHGFIAETGIEQLVRDVRVTTIYEGTTSIQAHDLLTRKVLADDGRRLGLLLNNIRGWATSQATEHACFTEAALNTAAKLEAATHLLATRYGEDTELTLQASVAYLRLAGHSVLAYVWARNAVAAAYAPAASAWHKAKIETARFYVEQLLPEVDQLMAAIQAPARPWADALAA